MNISKSKKRSYVHYLPPNLFDHEKPFSQFMGLPFFLTVYSKCGRWPSAGPQRDKELVPAYDSFVPLIHCVVQPTLLFPIARLSQWMKQSTDSGLSSLSCHRLLATSSGICCFESGNSDQLGSVSTLIFLPSSLRIP